MQLAFDFGRKQKSFPSSLEMGFRKKQVQLRLVYECVSRGGSYTFDEIGQYMWNKAACKACSTGISARIRQLNERLKPQGFIIKHRPQKDGSNLMIYYLEKMK